MFSKYLKYKNKYINYKNQFGGLIVKPVGDHKFQEYEIKESKDKNESCSICSEELKENNKLSKLNCGHIFHTHCIEEWREKKKTCPLCRHNSIDIYDKYNDMWSNRIIYTYNVNNKNNIRDIPINTVELTFGNSFNQPLDVGDIPSNVKKLTFGNSFDQEIKVNVIPQNVKELTFGNRFDQEIKYNAIPPSVIKLTFGKSFNQPLNYETMNIPSGYDLSPVFPFNILPPILKQYFTNQQIYLKSLIPNVEELILKKYYMHFNILTLVNPKTKIMHI